MQRVIGLKNGTAVAILSGCMLLEQKKREGGRTSLLDRDAPGILFVCSERHTSAAGVGLGLEYVLTSRRMRKEG